MSAHNPHTGRPYEEASSREPDPGPAGEIAEGQGASPAPETAPARESTPPAEPAGPAEELGPSTSAPPEEGQARGAGAAFAADVAPATAASPAQPTAMSQQEVAIRSALETVMDPEIGLSVIDLGLIREIHLLEGRTLVRMMLTTPFCPYAPQMMEDVKGATMSAVPQPCEVEILPDAWSPDMMPDPGLLGFSF